MNYSKSAWARQLGISNKELENRAEAAGYDTTEAYFNATGGTGKTSSDIIKGFEKEDVGFLNRYTKAIPNIYARLSKDQGLDTARSEAQTAVGNLEAIPGQVGTSAKQFGMSTSNINKRIMALQGKWQPIAQKAVGQAQFAQESVNQLFQNELMPFSVEAGQIASRHAQAMTGYTSEVKNRLDFTLNRLAAGEAITAQEVADAQEIAVLEKQYELALKNALALKSAGGGGDVQNVFDNKSVELPGGLLSEDKRRSLDEKNQNWGTANTSAYNNAPIWTNPVNPYMTNLGIGY
jgi:hypothetical protein